MTAIEPFELDACRGFSIELSDGSDPDEFVLAVSEYGDEVVCERDERDLEPQREYIHYSSCLGEALQQLGLLSDAEEESG
jgi:hypothetical protein